MLKVNTILVNFLNLIEGKDITKYYICKNICNKILQSTLILFCDYCYWLHEQYIRNIDTIRRKKAIRKSILLAVGMKRWL